MSDKGGRNMKRIGIMIGMMTLIVTSSYVSAEGPPGLTKKGKVPPGFSQGRKVGWQNEYPPGWSKKNEQEQNQWKEAVKKGRDGVSKEAKEKGLSAEEAESAADDYERAARKGLDPEEAESLVEDKITKGKKGNDLSVSAAEEAEILLKEKAQEAKKAKDTGTSKNKGKGKKK
jgi:hypothetical protein